MPVRAGNRNRPIIPNKQAEPVPAEPNETEPNEAEGIEVYVRVAYNSVTQRIELESNAPSPFALLGLLHDGQGHVLSQVADRLAHDGEVQD